MARKKVRLCPLLASASISGFVGLFLYGMEDPFNLLGKPTGVSIGIMLLSITFAVFAVMGVWTSVRERRADVNRGVYWHSTIGSLTHLTVAIYLMWFGVIGIRVWV